MNKDIDFLDDADFRLLDVSMELFALEDYLELLEKQIEHFRKSEGLILEASIKKQNLTPDDPEWHDARQNYYERIDFFLPRFFRGPFLVSLYAVYESAVTEIARLIQKKQGQALSIDDIKGNNFLDRAKKYYEHILRFELYKENTSWQHINMLSDIRNAIAHTNGRLEMLGGKSKDRIREWKKKNIGINIYWDYIIIDAAFLQKIFVSVRGSLDELVERYKQWDNAGGSV
ncbi:hypothetical protein ACFL60_07405 [Candidatus Omnitrophota bacterium]